MSDRVAELLRESLSEPRVVRFDDVARARHVRRRRGRSAIAAITVIVLAAAVIVAVLPRDHDRAPLAESGRTTTIGVITVDVPTGWRTGLSDACGVEYSFAVSEDEYGVGCGLDVSDRGPRRGPATPAIIVGATVPADSVPQHATVDGQPVEVVTTPRSKEQPYAKVDLSFPLFGTSIEARAATVAQARGLLTSVQLAAPAPSINVLPTGTIMSVGDGALVRDPVLIDRIAGELRGLPRLPPTTICPALLADHVDGIGTAPRFGYVDGCAQLVHGDGNLYAMTPQLQADLAIAETALPELHGKTPTAATTALQALGLVVHVQSQSVPSTTVPAGRVTGTVPAWGTPAPRGSTVTLVLSAG